MAIQSAGRLVGVKPPAQILNRRSMSLTGLRMTYAKIYETQPAVRTVVGFLARNAADIGIHAFSMSPDGQDRTRQRDTPLARLIRRPNPRLTQYDWINGLVCDLGIFDFHISAKVRGDDGQLWLAPLLPEMVEPIGDNWLWPEGFRVGGRNGMDLAAEDAFYVHGYHPNSRHTGLSPMESLRRILASDYAAEDFRERFWERGAQLSGIITRPSNAPQWSSDAKSRFVSQWAARYSSTGSEAGGTPLLEDGMTYEAVGASAKDSEYVASRKLTREEVAAVYFTSPTMVGILDNANYSNVKEFHKGLYQDTLGPTFTQLQQALWLQLVPEVGDPDLDYLEFNVMAKLAGTFEEQATIFSTAVGGPWMTRDEARARVNLPQLNDQGTDQLIVPMNVTEGGQASPRDSAPPKRFTIAPLRKAAKLDPFRVGADPELAADTIAAIEKTFDRQRRTVIARLDQAKAATKATAAELFDVDRYNGELAADLLREALAAAGGTAASVLAAAGKDPSTATAEPMRAWLEVKATAQAAEINAATLAAIEAALDEDDPATAIDQQLGANGPTRAAALGATFVAAVTGFAATDTAKAVGYASKVWVVTSPKSRHPELNGETVGIDETFSNGARWPGDSGGGVDEAAGCTCELEIVTED